MVEQTYEAVTVYYARQGAELHPTDKVIIGDDASEAQHHYSNTDGTAGRGKEQQLYALTSGWVGAPPAKDSVSCLSKADGVPCGCTAANPISTPTASVGVREIHNSSSMTLRLLGGRGDGGGVGGVGDGGLVCEQVLLRRTMDYECFNQQGERLSQHNPCTSMLRPQR